jgi:hypothetical protein
MKANAIKPTTRELMITFLSDFLSGTAGPSV